MARFLSFFVRVFLGALIYLLLFTGAFVCDEAV